MKSIVTRLLALFALAGLALPATAGMIPDTFGNVRLVSRTAPPTLLNLASYGVTDWTPKVGVRRLSWRQYAPTKEYADLLADFLGTTTVKDCYTDPTSAGGAGTSASPYTNISSCWTLAPTEATVRINARVDAKRILWGARATTGASTPVRNIILRADDGGELIVAQGVLSAPPTWTANGDGTYTTSTTTSSAAVSPPVDWSPASRAEQIDGVGRTFAVTQGTTDASDAGVRAALLPGRAYLNTSTGTANLTIRPFGDRAQASWDGYVIPGATPAAGYMLLKLEDTTPANTAFFMSRVSTSGGAGWLLQNRRTTAGGQALAVFDRGGAVSTGSAANGISATGSWQVIGYDQKFDQINEDALNIHSTSAGQPSWISGQAQAIWVRATVNYVGLSGSGTSNNQTEHEDARALSIMVSYRGGNGRPYASIDNARSVIFGGSIGPSTRTQAQAYYETVSAGTNAQLTIVEATIGSSQGPYDLGADTTGTAFAKVFGTSQGAYRFLGGVTFQPPLP